VCCDGTWNRPDQTNVLNAYHALAIDERRRPFRPTLWVQQDDTENQTLEQVWFSGVHCDVGGGYRDPGLSEIPLQWMAEKARSCGLVFKPDHLVVTRTTIDDEARRAGIHLVPDHAAELHDSRTRYYKLQPAYDRRLANDDGSDVDGGALASSAKRRHDEDATYQPRGLAEWIAASKPITSGAEERE
jgi:hypothetical protein